MDGPNDGRSTLDPFQGKKLEITFTTTLNNTAIAGIITNSATLTTNGISASSSNSHLHFNAVAIEKYYMRTPTTKIPGASFQIATTETKARAGQFLKKDSVTGAILDTGDSGYSTASVWEITTDANGYAVFPGLSYQLANPDAEPAPIPEGTEYWIVETVAPAGYNMLRNPVPFTVKSGVSTLTDADSRTYTNLGGIAKIGNNTGFELPTTGGTGAIILSVVGVFLMVGAIIMLIGNRRKRVKSS